MALSSLYTPNSTLFPPHSVYLGFNSIKTTRSRRTSCSRLPVSSSHSNPKILKSNRRSRFGQRLSPYDNDNEHQAVDDDDDDEDEYDWLSDDPGPGFDNDKHKRKAQATTNGSINGGSMYSRMGRKQKINGNGKVMLDRNNYTGKDKQESGKSSKNKYRRLLDDIDVDEKWFPLLDYLGTFGLKDSHFIQMYSRHMPSLQINVTAAKERLDYLMSVGVKTKDIKKILMRQPQILQYTVESNLKSHVAFLVSLGIQDSRIGQIITATPSIFSYSVENSLKPTVRYLIEEVGIRESDLSKVVQLSPQILVQRIDNSWNARYRFLSKELGAPRDSIVKMVTKHPQLLHYSIEDGLLPRINFLRSIGMHNSDILKVSTSLTQVFSLSLEGNLKPKYLYLVNELQNEVKSLTKYPTYLSLSLDQRIRPRHKFLVALKKAPEGPFPLSSFVPNDESFCQQWAGTSVDKYLAFRQRLLLKDLAKKYERS
ncbi:putative transcription regulator mTERF family [Helianthus annuus]|uniref:Putative transcription termination factor n=1 Tax=Helianthus annuus TaxID=4232 RepID=A0A251UBC4_HELAN|nr:transcription termination factor MTERF9, chloroplastic isoform X1 [Helianthus annuus]XP_021978458.1 transcription termination factor MTERF9, chloroplastic isoform X1 [Helianthus annuus]XP_035831667.1 transcription termination factor MTERF9, chloroplastic isoform X1 [Helianthus annuus]KAF5796568.1 putative transcription regulator mTERF family [Helianthus annuus]KAJ0554593.1 putative transcription regulator mTERF family [Helianthus annuus]KAJ0720156.1 putative transcription regulator mTERF fa